MKTSPLPQSHGRQIIADLRAKLRIPVVVSPMFLISNTDMVVASCKSGIIGSFPALNARPQLEFDVWLTRIKKALDVARAEGINPAPFAVNLTLRKTNTRLEDDINTCEKHEVPILITSLSAPDQVVKRIHAYGGLVFHDVTTVKHANRALAANVDGLVLVCAGAGGHGGTLNPFAFLAEVRDFYDGPIILAGTLSTGGQVLAAEIMGADLVYMGTRFIATRESSALDENKEMLVESCASDIIYTPYFSGTPANYLCPSIIRAELDLEKVHQATVGVSSALGERQLRWKDIWGAGQGVGQITDLPDVAALTDRLADEYVKARTDWARSLSGREV